MPKQKQPEIDTTVYEDVTHQIPYFDFPISTVSRKKDVKGKVMRFDTWLNKRPEHYPAAPILTLRDVGLSIVGDREKKTRGINVYRGKGFAMTTLGLIINGSCEEPRKLIQGALQKFTEKFDPTRKSMQYQRWFDSLTDGTKVFQATQSLSDVDGSILNQITDDGDFMYDVPEKNFGNYLFDSESPWYLSARMPQGNAEHPVHYKVFCFDAKGSQFSGKGASESAYIRGGISFTDLDAIERLMSSDFFTKRRWKCDVQIALANFSLKLGECNGEPMLYPMFDFRVASSIAFQISDEEGDAAIMTPEQRATFHDSIVLRGKTGVSKKRKHVKETKTNAPKKPKASRSVSFVPTTQQPNFDEEEEEEDDDEDEDATQELDSE